MMLNFQLKEKSAGNDGLNAEFYKCITEISLCFYVDCLIIYSQLVCFLTHGLNVLSVLYI